MLYKLYITQSILNLDIVFLKNNLTVAMHKMGLHIFIFMSISFEIKGYTSKIMMSHGIPTDSLLLQCTSFLKQIFILI